MDGQTGVAIGATTGELDLSADAANVDINAATTVTIDSATTTAITGGTGVTIGSTANDVSISGARDVNNTAVRNYNITSAETNINSSKITIGKTDGSSAVVLPGLARTGTTENGFVTVTPDGTLARSSFSVNDVQDALKKVDDGINQIGAMSMAVSALPNFTSGEKKYGCGVGTGVMGNAWAGAAGCVVKVKSNIWVNAAVSYAPGVETEFGSTASLAGRMGAFWAF